MHDQRTGRHREGEPPSRVAQVEDQTDRLILTLLLSSQFPGLWSIDELKREIGRSIEVADSIRRLHGQGLIHKIEDYVFVTHAVACYEQLRV
jgi:hypothetical protein